MSEEGGRSDAEARRAFGSDGAATDREGPDAGSGHGPEAWHDRTSEDVRALADEDPVVVLPLAAVEQHGPHLPLSTDRVIGQGILDAALGELSGEEQRILVLPTQATGTSLEHERYPGTLSLDPGTLQRVLNDTGRSLSRAGVRRMVISNSHGGNRAAVDLTAMALRRELGMLVVKAHYFRFPRPVSVELPEREWRHGLHGGAVETAMMLHLRPDLVRVEGIRRFRSLGEELEDRLARLAPEGQAAFAWTAEDLSPEGVTGDATLADARMGQLLVRHYGSCLADIIRDTGRFPLERLEGETA